MEDPSSDWGRSYAVDIGLPGAVIEKPRLGLGAYFFRWSILPHLEKEKSITGVLDKAIQERSVVNIPFTGKYLNVTYPEDLERWTP